MSRYAQNTSVSVAKSKAEIEQTLRRYGASGFMSAWQDDPPMAMVGFSIDGRMVKMHVTVPAQDDEEFTLTETGRDRNESQAYKAWERACRQRWRALALIVKAKLEAVECGISSIEREFLADIVLHDGSTFGDWAGPQLEEMYEKGRMPQLLSAPKKRIKR
jgi:hypothetical protein